MKFNRLSTQGTAGVVRSLTAEGLLVDSLLGDNRELMRHDEGAIHAVVTGSNGKGRALFLFGSGEFDEELTSLSGPFAEEDAANPATDSNQNGVYVAFTQKSNDGRSGYIAHVPDPFGDPSDIRLHGPLTPPDGNAENSFLQASRAENSVAYAWRDNSTGEIHVGICADGVTFPSATPIVNDAHAVRGPAIGIQGDYAICTYQTTNPEFAPIDSQADGAYYAWLESGDRGATWTEPKPLFPTADELPHATGLTLKSGNDLIRSEIKVSGGSYGGVLAAQILAWVNPLDYPDSRVFAMTTLTPAIEPEGSDWAPNIGVLAFKDFGVGGDWGYTITNRNLYRRSAVNEGYAGRAGKYFKYSALPGTKVRVVSYVDSAPEGSGLEDQIAILVSTTKGDTFDYETVFSASDLTFEPDAELLISNSACCYADTEGRIWQDLLIGDLKRPSRVVHATLPIGLSVEGRDPTLVW
jgi:hypothetical protein